MRLRCLWVRPVAFGEAEAGLSMAKLVEQQDRSQIGLDLRKKDEAAETPPLATNASARLLLLAF